MKATYTDAITAIQQLTANNFVAYLAGGCVRDLLLHLEPNDYDIATSATPSEVLSLFDKTVTVGESFGVVKVIFGDARELDIATFRTDGAYSDNRRPDTVQYNTNAEEDVKRRDFTINAMLMGPDKRVIDFVEGEADLQDRIIRTVGCPDDRFKEDALRMMRAIRFAIRFNMTIHPDTWEAIKNNSSNIKSISAERITDELTKIFSYGRCDIAYHLLVTSGLWEKILPISNGLVWERLKALSKVMPGDPLIMVLAILLEYKDLTKLRLTNKQREDFSLLSEGAKGFAYFYCSSLSKQRKMLQWDNLELVKKLLLCWRGTGYLEYYFSSQVPLFATLEVLEAKQKEVLAMGWPDPLINGNVLIDMGFIQSPIFSVILEEIRTEQLEGRITSINQVRPYILSKYPAIPRMVNGVLLDETRARRLGARCPQCSKQMGVTVPKDIYGKYQWSQASNLINIRYGTSTFYYCQSCYSRKKKTLFVEMTM